MIKKLMKSIREYKKDSLLSPAMVTLEVIMEVIIPMLMARLIDYGIQAQNLGYIWKMGILLAVTAMISLMFGVLSGTEVDSMADVSESGETSAGRAATVSDGEGEAVVADDVSSPAEF